VNLLQPTSKLFTNSCPLLLKLPLSMQTRLFYWCPCRRSTVSRPAAGEKNDRAAETWPPPEATPSTELPVLLAVWGVRTANQIMLPGFLSSMISCTDLCRKLFPSCSQSLTGSLDRHFIDACEQCVDEQDTCHTTFRSATEKWDLPLADATLSLLLSTAPTQSARVWSTSPSTLL